MGAEEGDDGLLMGHWMYTWKTCDSCSGAGSVRYYDPSSRWSDSAGYVYGVCSWCEGAGMQAA